MESLVQHFAHTRLVVPCLTMGQLEEACQEWVVVRLLGQRIGCPVDLEGLEVHHDCPLRILVHDLEGRREYRPRSESG